VNGSSKSAIRVIRRQSGRPRGGHGTRPTKVIKCATMSAFGTGGSFLNADGLAASAGARPTAGGRERPTAGRGPGDPHPNAAPTGRFKKFCGGRGNRAGSCDFIFARPAAQSNRSALRFFRPNSQRVPCARVCPPIWQGGGGPAGAPWWVGGRPPRFRDFLIRGSPEKFLGDFTAARAWTWVRFR